MDERRYGVWAQRQDCLAVLDAQYFGVPQRRERVFLVASLGKAARSFRPEAVLLERRTEGDGSSKRRTKRQPAAGTAGEGADVAFCNEAGPGAGSAKNVSRR
ncbi:DNA cytosine methyltransferase [Aquamicrobium soli]|uniref:DNA cytosine methyltransferase n=1 Tax=Aquamicrobium soli TaxID=1811518 RepID=A0ABV7K843_9HYPH